MSVMDVMRSVRRLGGVGNAHKRALPPSRVAHHRCFE
jgi:hypothetical protein